MTDVDTSHQNTQNTTTDAETIYKKWHRTGFISIGYWATADKLTIEVGKVGSNNSLESATKCFIPVAQFLGYLRAEIGNNLLNIYPKFMDSGLTFYGGGPTANGIVSRVFKATVWGTGDQADMNARAFKCGHFPGIKTDQGAIQPDKTKPPISTDHIKMSMQDLAEIYETINLRVIAERTAPIVADRVATAVSDKVADKVAQVIASMPANV